MPWAVEGCVPLGERGSGTPGCGSAEGRLAVCRWGGKSKHDLNTACWPTQGQRDAEGSEDGLCSVSPSARPRPLCDAKAVLSS